MSRYIDADELYEKNAEKRIAESSILTIVAGTAKEKIKKEKEE